MLLGGKRRALFSQVTCAESRAFIARTSGLDAVHTKAYHRLITSLVQAGLWAKLDLLYILATQDATTAALNLLSTSFGLTLVNSPTFTADRGYAGNGSSSYINTGYAPGTNGVQYTQDSSSFGVWSLTDKAAADTYEMGARVGATNLANLITKNSAGNYRITVNQAAAGSLSVANSNAAGFYAANRSASNAQQEYRNGALFGSNATASVTPPTAIFFIDAGSVNVSTPEAYSVTQIAVAFAGASFTATEHATLYSIFSRYMQAIGAI